MIALTTTYWKIKDMVKPIRLIQGGQGAGKNYAMALRLLDHASEGARVITVLTDTYDNLKDGIITDYEHIFSWSDLNLYDYYNRQDKTLYWGDCKIQFRYLADHKKQSGKSKRRDVLYINEGNKNGWGTVQHYVARSKITYVDFNPDFEFWSHTELEPRDDCEKIIVTYLDNEMCPENEVRYIESRKDNEEWYRVYGLGLTGTYSDLRIYQFNIVEEVPSQAKRIPSGMDFGQSPDPTIRVDAWIDGIDLYLDEVFCENNLMPEKITGAERASIVDRLNDFALEYARSCFRDKSFDKIDEYYLGKETDKEDEGDQDLIAFRTKIREYKKWLTIGDSSGAVELKDMKKHGYNVRGVKKGPGSVKEGIKKLRGYNIHITKRSENLKNGFESWFWKEDHNGKIVPEPDGHEPDGLAAARYIILSKPLWK